MPPTSPPPRGMPRLSDDHPVGREEVSTRSSDLTKGYVPLALILTFIIPTAIYVGLYIGKRDAGSEALGTQLSSLQQQVTALTAQVSSIAVTVAKPPQIPENVAFKADLLRFCVENRQLKCPPI